MGLIKTIAEIKEVLPKFIPNNLDSKVLPNFDQAEAKYVVPITGIELYNALHTKYNSAPQTLTDDEKALLKKVRLVACAYAFRDEQAYGHLTLSEVGIRKVQATQTAEIRKWEYEKLAAALSTLAADATETLLLFLYEKKFAQWVASDVYKNYNRLLIRTGTEFSSLYTLHQPMRTFMALRPVVLTAQTLYITQGTGTDLLQYLLQLATVPEGLKRGMDFLKTSLCFFAIMEACNVFSVQFSESGFTVLSGEMNSDIEDAGRKTADAQTLQLKMASSNTRGNDFLCLAQIELTKFYKTDAASAEYKTALEAGPLKDFLEPKVQTTGNERRKIFVL